MPTQINRDTITCLGESGTKYKLTKYSLNETLPKCGGVYFIAARVKEKGVTTTKPIYIGESENFYNRITDQHERWDCFIKNGADIVGLLQEDSNEHRLNIETDIRHKYKTPCNRQ